MKNEQCLMVMGAIEKVILQALIDQQKCVEDRPTDLLAHANVFLGDAVTKTKILHQASLMQSSHVLVLFAIGKDIICWMESLATLADEWFVLVVVTVFPVRCGKISFAPGTLVNNI